MTMHEDAPHRDRGTGSSSSRSSRTACRRASGSAPRPARLCRRERSSVETVRPDGTRQSFAMQDRGGYLESIDEIPEPHAFAAQRAHRRAGLSASSSRSTSTTHARRAHRDNNMRAAVIHVMADAAVSVLVIVGLVLARAFGWLWMDPLAGIVGACVIASWSYGLIRDTGAVLLDMVPDQRMADGVRRAIEAEGDQVADLHFWRLGPGHLGAILSVVTARERGPEFYRGHLARFPALSHLTVEVQQAAPGRRPRGG